ncbi:CD63 antigen-like [Homarus americanus]|uniref:CD63 antigen-like n=1 Tax=Homarus americanus TaxID=6706 RepID=UPI001C491155|nr:CD63 antigen-like [Homarus americanus]
MWVQPAMVMTAMPREESEPEDPGPTFCNQFIRLLLVIINLIALMGSLCILVLGTMIMMNHPYLAQMMGQDMFSMAAKIMMASGSFIFVVSFLGCCGALKEIKFMLMLYFIFVALLFMILLAGGVIGLIFMSKAKARVISVMEDALRDYEPDSTNSSFTLALDLLQHKMQCCGIEGQHDWEKFASEFNETGYKIPKSCCKDITSYSLVEECQQNPNEENSHIEGCFSKAISFVTKHSRIIGSVGVSIAMILIFGLFSSLALVKMIDSRYDSV